jgi:hypothetical protein
VLLSFADGRNDCFMQLITLADSFTNDGNETITVETISSRCGMLMLLLCRSCNTTATIPSTATTSNNKTVMGIPKMHPPQRCMFLKGDWCSSLHDLQLWL